MDAQSDNFARRLHEVGVVQSDHVIRTPYTAPQQGQRAQSDPSMQAAMPSSLDNTTLLVLRARKSLQKAADDAVNLAGVTQHTKRFVDMRTLMDALSMRQRGISTPVIERKLGLHPGMMERLGNPKVVTHASGR